MLRWQLWVFLFAAFLEIAAAAQNRTIDDTLGDSVTGVRPVYFPVKGTWEDKTCTNCSIQADPGIAFDGTWMAATYTAGVQKMSVNLQFEGTAITVFFILANAVQGSGITSLTEASFRLDGTIASSFAHVSDNTGALRYNVPVFSSPVLPFANHTLSIEVTGDHDVFVMFDYAEYTFDDSLIPAPAPTSGPIRPMTTSGSTSMAILPDTTAPNRISVAGIIAGCILGAVLLLATLVLLGLFLRHRRRRRTTPLNLKISPLILETSKRTDRTTPVALLAHANSFAAPDAAPSWQAASQLSRAATFPAPSNAPAPANAFAFNNTFPGNTFAPGTGGNSRNVLSPTDADVAALAALAAAERARVRARRQGELQRRMARQRDEMEALQRTATPGHTTDPQVAQQLQRMMTQIRRLEAAQQSEWANGLSDRHPPGFTME